MGRNKNLSAQTMWEIQQILRENHVFYPKYRQAHEIFSQAREKGASETDLTVRLHFNAATDRHHYNLPASNKIALILPGDGSAPEGSRDIILRLRGGPLECIHEGNLAYLPLHYVLFFSYGELGWQDELRQVVVDDNGRTIEDQSNAPCLTQMDFYSFRLFSRHTEFSSILHGGKLLQEFMVDAWAVTEQNRLRFLCINQGVLRADIYQGLMDAIGAIANTEINLANLGRHIILPLSHIGSARH
ncbi:23626_t:CDS:1, partial [Cetraspora pellucida]